MKAGWQTKTLENMCEIYQPQTITTKEMVEDGAYSVFGANGIIGRYNKFNHEKPQLLITCRGATCGAVNISEPFSWVTGNAMVVRPKNAELDLQLLEYIFRGAIDISKAITGAAQPQITRTNLAPIKISYPISILEQQRIVAILNEAFEGIDTATANAKKNLANARELFQNYLKLVFAKKGDGWSEKPLETLASILNGYAFQSGDFIKSKGVNCIKITNVGVREFVFDSDTYLPDSFAKKYQEVSVQQGSIVIALTRTIISDGLKVAIVPNDYHNALLNQRVASILATTNVMTQIYLFAYLSSSFASDYVKAHVNTLMQPNLSIKDLRSMPIPLPSLQKQNQITYHLAILREETQKLEAIYQQKLTALEELKKSILNQAFSGQLN